MDIEYKATSRIKSLQDIRAGDIFVFADSTQGNDADFYLAIQNNTFVRLKDFQAFTLEEWLKNIPQNAWVIIYKATLTLE